MLLCVLISLPDLLILVLKADWVRILGISVPVDCHEEDDIGASKGWRGTRQKDEAHHKGSSNLT